MTAGPPPLALDVTGLNCPLPFLKLRRTLRGLPAGTRLEVLSNDPLAPGDFAELCESQGHLLVETSQRDGVTRTLIEVGPPAQGAK